MKIQCLPIDVYRFRLGDCTNNGMSSMFGQLLLACPNGPETFDSEKELPLNFCKIVWKYGIAQVYPAMIDEFGLPAVRPGWWMYGGNIADSSDCRLRELTGIWYPLHIHDRRE